ncbi:uncharacterized protein BDZ99DRAFT_254139 [Mytilinidion resinicola]|uniref:Uncharacterized protein n=1 Tax=Mytilinidion resinicola TaxID=574789 RepID=A0A6A6YX04_9PEZI|nr:uncharacterized protein BDZ99DRAFT_254139 [Mytilinidion resinicola]KAF2813341.1 hypothetical protein BDZ99DRAFT_254139 [Mytilinidion resinicola]
MSAITSAPTSAQLLPSFYPTPEPSFVNPGSPFSNYELHQLQNPSSQQPLPPLPTPQPYPTQGQSLMNSASNHAIYEPHQLQILRKSLPWLRREETDLPDHRYPQPPPTASEPLQPPPTPHAFEPYTLELSPQQEDEMAYKLH